MMRLTTALARAIASPAAADLPLPRGFYVSADTACGAASHASLTLLHREGIDGARDSCAFERIEAEGSARFRIRERCADMHDPANAVVRDGAYEILASDRFRRSADDWTEESRHCPQNTVPEPWRSNDISDTLR